MAGRSSAVKSSSPPRLISLIGAGLLLLGVAQSPLLAIGVWQPVLPGAGGDWDDPSHWNGNTLPSDGESVAVGPILTNPGTIVFRRYLAPDEAYLETTLGGYQLTFDHSDGELLRTISLFLQDDLIYELNGGILEFGHLRIGADTDTDAADAPVMNIRNGGTIMPDPSQIDNEISVGGIGHGTINQYGGSVSTLNLNISNNANTGGAVADYDGTYNLMGGTVDIGNLSLGDGAVSSMGSGTRTATVDISGGHFKAKRVFMDGSSRSILNVSSGTLSVIDNDLGLIRIGTLAPAVLPPDPAIVSEVAISGNAFVEADGIVVGDEAQGIMTQSGNALVDIYALSVGDGSFGDYLMLGGTLEAHQIDLGSPLSQGFGTITQTGGVVNSRDDGSDERGWLQIRGYDDDHRSNYVLNGGTLLTEGGTSIEDGHFQHIAGNHTSLKNVTVSDQGLYTMQSGTLNTDIFGTFLVSGTVSGKMEHEGGTVLANHLANQGFYLQSGGSLSVSGTLDSGGSYVKTGGTAVLGDFEGNGAVVESDLTVTGTFAAKSFTISSGTLSLATVSTLDGIVDQMSGAVTVANTFTVGRDAVFDDPSIWVLREGTLHVGATILGNNAQGTFRQNGGVFTSGTETYIGYRGSGSYETEGRFELNDGFARVESMFVGRDEDGTFIQTDGDFLALAEVTVGSNNGEAGAAFRSGTGLFQLDGGTARVEDLSLGDGGEGSVTINGGSLTVDSALVVGVDDDNPSAVGSGTFSQVSGTVTASNAVFGDGASGNGSLSGGSLQVSGKTEIGKSAAGVLAVSGSGSFSSGSLDVLGSGQLTLAGGSSTITGTSTVTGAVTLESGAEWQTGDLDLGGVRSRLTWNGGTLNLTDSGLSAASGSSWGDTLTLASGQILSVSGSVAAGNLGTMTIETDSALSASALVQESGGNFTQSGGAINVGEADFSQGSGKTTRLEAGTFDTVGDFSYAGNEIVVGRILGSTKVQVGADFHVNGLFSLLVQSGSSSVNVTGDFILGSGFSDDVSYSLSESATLETGNSKIGANGDGSFVQRIGTTHTVNNVLEVGQRSGTTNIYTLQDGQLNTGDTRIGLQSFSSGLITQSSGTHQVSGDLALGFGNGSSGSYVLHGGSIAADQVLVGVLGSGSMRQTGGSVTATTKIAVKSGSGYELEGGGITAPVFENHGSLLISATTTTTVSAELSSDGLIDIDGDVLLDRAGASHANAGILEIQEGKTLTLSGSSQFLNGSAGLIRGKGTLKAESGSGFVNSGTLAPGSSPGELTIDGAFTQDSGGLIDMEIGGLTAGLDYDQIHFLGGPASLEGTLRITFINGFEAEDGDSFSLFTGVATYDFSAIDIVNAPPGTMFDTAVSMGSFQLNVVPEPGTFLSLLLAIGIFLTRRVMRRVDPV